MDFIFKIEPYKTPQGDGNIIPEVFSDCVGTLNLIKPRKGTETKTVLSFPLRKHKLNLIKPRKGTETQSGMFPALHRTN